MRLFVAIHVPPTDAFRNVRRDLNGQLCAARWTAEENFHMTLKFLGETDESRVADLNAALSKAVAGREPFEVCLKGIGAFPTEINPLVVWAGTSAGRSLLETLSARVEEEVVKTGFGSADKPFRPHLTLARIKKGRPLHDLSVFEKYSGVDFMTFPVRGIFLFQSELKPAGPVYRVIQTHPLSSGGSKNGFL